MILDLIKKNFGEISYQMETKITRLRPERIARDGVMSISQSFEEYDFVSALKDFKSSDFSIDNILAVGAFDMLKPMYITTMSSLDVADSFQNIPLPQKTE